MKLCVFQGTFNPIHKAHLDMAEYVLRKFGFDRIIFIPAFRPPHKAYDTALTPHRFKMVELAARQNPKFEVSDIEYQNDRKSYTYFTILELYKKYEIDGKIYFIIGTDAFKNLKSWYETDKLKELLTFIVFKRGDEKISSDYDFIEADMEFEDISSTDIRERINRGKSITGLVTKEVEEYINENGLYKS